MRPLHPEIQKEYEKERTQVIIAGVICLLMTTITPPLMISLALAFAELSWEPLNPINWNSFARFMMAMWAFAMIPVGISISASQLRDVEHKYR